jgi:hypothetical protein
MHITLFYTSIKKEIGLSSNPFPAFASNNIQVFEKTIHLPFSSLLLQKKLPGA